MPETTAKARKEHKRAFMGSSLCTSRPTLRNYMRPIAIMTAGHLLVAASINHFLRLELPQQAAVALLFCALSAAFPYSYLRLRKTKGPLIQKMYAISAFWLGTAINLVLAATANWALEAPRLLLGLPVPQPATFLAAVTLAVGYSLYGTWNAFTPRIRHHTAAIRGLPPHWHNRKIVHISDLHLGYIFGERQLRKAVDSIRQMKPDMTAITGDLSDSIPRDIPIQIAPLKDLADHAPVLFAPGNHDPTEIFPHLRRAGVTILNDHAINIKGLQVAGASCSGRKAPARDLRTSIKDYQAGIPTILLKHIPIHTEASRDAGVHLQLSGHTHGGQQFPFSAIAKRIYKGFNSGFHTMGDFSINISMGLGTWGPPMRTATTPEITAITITGTATTETT